MPSEWEWEYSLESASLVPKHRMADKGLEGRRTAYIVETSIGHNNKALGNITHSIAVCAVFAAQIWVWEIAPSPLHGCMG